MEREPDEAGMSAVERLRRDEIPTVRLGRRLLVPKARPLAMLDGDSADSATTEEEAA